MSPEQARGRPVDKRADIWAFGVVLYEMVMGHQLFRGETVSDTLAAVLTRDPDWNQVPPRVRALLQGCLEKDHKRRLRDITDGWRLIDAIADGAPERKQRMPWIWILVASLALGLAYLS